MNLPDDIQSLKQQLASAQAKLQQYTDIVISQANELRLLRDHLCQNCKKTSPESSGGTTSSALIYSSPSKPIDRKPFWRRVLSRPFPTKRPVLIQPLDLVSDSPPTPNSSVIRLPLCVEVSNSARTVSTSAKPAVPCVVKSGWLVENHIIENPAVDATFERAFALEANVICVKFSRDGKYLAASVGNFTGKAIVCEVESAKEIVLSEPSRDDQVGIGPLGFTPDGEHLAVAGLDGLIRLWKISAKRVRSTYPIFRFITALDVSPDGRFIACASGYTIVMWRIRDGDKKIFSDVNYYLSTFLRFTPNGLHIITVDCSDKLSVWDIRTSQLVARWTKEEEYTQIQGLRGSFNESLRFWTVSSVGVNTTDEEGQEEEIIMYTGHRRTPDSVAIAVSPDGRWVVDSSEDVEVQMWDARDSLQQCSLFGHQGRTTTMDFSPTGQYVAVGDTTGYLSLWSYQPRTSVNLQSSRPSVQYRRLTRLRPSTGA